MEYVNLVLEYYLSRPPLDLFAQGMVFLFSMFALYCMSFAGGDPHSIKMRMYGGAAGLASEPFWVITTVMNGQVTIVFMCFIYAYAWTKVLLNNRKQYYEELARRSR